MKTDTLYGQLFERLVHKIRTPLGVSFGLLKDASEGYTLTKEDFLDGVRSTERIELLLSMVDSLCGDGDSEETNGSIVYDVLVSLGEKPPEEEALRRAAFPSLRLSDLKSAIRLISRQYNVSHLVRVQLEERCLLFCWQLTNESLFEGRSGRYDFVKVAEKDFSERGIAVLVTEILLRRNGVSAEVLIKDGEVAICFKLPWR